MRFVTLFLMILVVFSVQAERKAVNGALFSPSGKDWWYIIEESDMPLSRDSCGKFERINKVSLLDSFKVSFYADPEEWGKGQNQIILEMSGKDSLVLEKKKETKFFPKWAIVPMKEITISSFIGTKDGDDMDFFERGEKSVSVSRLLGAVVFLLFLSSLFVGGYEKNKRKFVLRVSFATSILAAIITFVAVTFAIPSVPNVIALLVAFFVIFISLYKANITIALLIIVLWLLVGPAFAAGVGIGCSVFGFAGYFLAKPKKIKIEKA